MEECNVSFHDQRGNDRGISLVGLITNSRIRQDNAEESSGLPSGKLWVTLWKSLGNPEENSG
jgi:hypothetical protein